MTPLLPRLSICAAVALFASPVPAQPQGTPAPAAFSITNVTGDLYRFQVGSQVSVFLVTPEGIILADPLGRATAALLEAELASRFPGRPVRYVVYTGYRFDRSEGAATFTDTAEITGHRSFDDQVSRARATASEMYQYVVPVESDYTSTRSITLGGRTVQLVALRGAEGADVTALYFPAERYVFLEAAPDLSRPFAAAAMSPRAVIAWVRTVAALDFDTLLTGDGTMTSRTVLVALASYLDDLHAGVLAGYEAGQTVAQIQASAFLDAHRGTPFYPQRQAHIAAVYRTVRAARMLISATPALNAFTPNSKYCASYTECEQELLAPAATIGLSVSVRQIVVAAEVSVERQSISSRTSPPYDDAWARRETTGSIMAGFGGPPARSRSFNILGGLSVIRADADGISRVKQAFSSVGGLRRRHARATRLGITGGVDLIMPIAGRLGVVFPVRATYSLGEPADTRPGPWSLRAGAGLRFAVYRTNY